MKHLQFSKLQTVAYSNSLIKLCAEAVASEDEVLFDLSKTEFIAPFGIVLLAGTISERLAQGRKSKYRRPNKDATRKFLSGIGFNDFFRISGDAHRIQSPKVQLRRLYQIDYLLIDQVLGVFESSIRMSKGVRSSLRLALNELMTNAFDHSESERGCYVCAQTYPQKKKIRLCITDFGIGIRKALKKSPEYKHLESDEESILLAVQEGITSREKTTAGYGLSHINRFMNVNDGKMHILSGKGKIMWDYSSSRKYRGKKQTMHFPFIGTIINLLINADREGLYFMQTDDGQIF